MKGAVALVPRAALVDLAQQVQRVRKLQSDYFKSRTSENLSVCRDAERRLDDRLRSVVERPDSQPTLFTEAIDQKIDAVMHALVLDVSAELLRLVDQLGRGGGDRHVAIRVIRQQVERLRTSVPASQGGAA